MSGCALRSRLDNGVLASSSVLKSDETDGLNTCVLAQIACVRLQTMTEAHGVSAPPPHLT